ncbi:hypothetical protein BDV97DRAFT_407305 [Delphinella strobiligena]|nr:hypothetical protein BDV97DRAFT_407305 [Delphinella strobiligena]
MAPPSQLLPTVSQLSNFLASFFPVRPKDVDFVYHTPRFRPRAQIKEQMPQSGFRSLPIDSTSVSKLIFSITPTPGVYHALSEPNLTPPLSFLHRPFTLDRRRILTVGYNPILAARLGLDVESSVCLQGYKGDPDRKIGIVGVLHTPVPAATLLRDITHEFGAYDDFHGFSNDAVDLLEDNNMIHTVAIMNAFHPEEVDRVMEAALARGWISDLGDDGSVLYLTGQARQPGLIAADAKHMKVVCVGHRTCEEWGIRYLAEQCRAKFPLLDVVEIFEDEEPRPPTSRPDATR